MAVVTHVYVFQHAHGVKVGITRMGPEERRADLERSAGIPIEHVASWLIESHGRALNIERWIHHKLDEHRAFGEWFDCPLEHVLEVSEWAVAKAPDSSPSICAQLQKWHESLVANGKHPALERWG